MAKEMLRTAVALTLAVLILAGCDSSLEPGRETLRWSASIVGAEGFDDVNGSANVVAEVESFELEVQLAGLADDLYEWQLAAGTCAAPGGRIGPTTAYPRLTPEPNGTITASTELFAILAAAAPYHVSLHVMVTDEDDVQTRALVACGDLGRM
jgi:hypothetical protein